MLLKCIDGLAVVAISVFSLWSMVFIAVMWCIRHSFFIAMRSPLLACCCGLCLTLRAWSATLEYVIAWGGRAPTDDGVVDLLGLPAVLAAEICAIMRAVRVLLMYYPSKRQAWGRLPKERAIVLNTGWAYALSQIVLWWAAAVYGIPRTADVTSTAVAPAAVLLALLSGLWLGFQLGKVDDMCSVGRESLNIGGFMIGSAFIYVAILVVPMSTVAFKYAHVVFAAISYAPVIWIVNIAPVLAVLKHTDKTRTGHGGFFLIHGIFPWRRGLHRARRVVASAASPRSVASQASNGPEERLDDIMHFLPLRDAFGEFCRKALCSESFNFLVDVADFKDAVRATFDPNDKETLAGEDFRKCLAIVKEYIESNARSEVNIDDNAKHEALRYTEQHDFISLSLVRDKERVRHMQDQRSEIFLLAEREISQLLADNLLVKFKASAPYKELVQDEELQEK